MADISKITLPSGNTYDIKDTVAREAISGGVSFIIAWDGASTPVPANIPEGIEVTYSGTTYTGTLDPDDAQPGAFYLVYSGTQGAGQHDVYDEYVPVGTPKTWEKIGDTQVNLEDVVTDVTLNKQTAGVIGSSSTFTITQPTIALATDSTSGTGKVQVATGISDAGASGGNVAWNSKDAKTVLTGVKVTTQPTVTLTANAATGTGRLKYVEDVTGGSTSPTKTNLSASASGGAVSASGDNVTAVTGVSTAKLAVTTVTGVSGSTNITPVESRTSQTTADGSGTASTTNTDWLKGVSVSNETLVIGAATLDTQTTYSAGAPRASLAVPTAASSATTVATGSTTSSGSGATVATGSSGTDTVLGTSSTFTVTNPTVTLASGSTGDVEVVSDVSDITVSPTYKYMSGSASGTAVGADGTASVIGGSSTFTVTQPTITVTPSTTYIKGTASGANTTWNSKDEKTALTDATSITVTKGSAEQKI